jgi:SAM-dependent methyltransferase
VTDDDVPAGVDFRNPDHAASWIAAAEDRPGRAELRRVIAAHVAAKSHVLELGGGPGFLAEEILAAGPVERYVLFDFAPPMIAAAHQRLGDRVRYHLGDFLAPDWPSQLDGTFDAIVTMQAVHELRHKRHAQRLYEQARLIMRPGAALVVCDHVPKGDARTTALHATAAEQLAAMTAAGFARPAILAELNAMYVIACAAT